MGRHNQTNKKTVTGTKTMTKTILAFCDWDTDCNYDDCNPDFMTIFVNWKLRVALDTDSIRNFCTVFKYWLKPLIVSDRSMRESALPSWTPTAWCLTPPLPSCLQTMAIWASMSPYPCAEWSNCNAATQQAGCSGFCDIDLPVTGLLLTSQDGNCEGSEGSVLQRKLTTSGHYWPTTCTGRPL